MQIDIVANPDSPHQASTAMALRAGMKRHGQAARIVTHVTQAQARTVVCWGWRNGRRVAGNGRRVLIMERAYVGDRFHWVSLGWDGLNGRARFPRVDDGGKRWRTHFPDALQQIQTGGAYVLVLGQVKGDASVDGVPLHEWYAYVGRTLSANTGLPVYFRPHPIELQRGKAPGKGRLHGMEIMAGPLEVDLANADCAVAWNSNSLTDAALAGVRIIAGDQGAMTWAIAGQSLHHPARLDGTERRAWARRLAWCQWLPSEIERGDAWDALKRVGIRDPQGVTIDDQEAA